MRNEPSFKTYEKIQSEINSLPLNEFLLSPEDEANRQSDKIDDLIKKSLSSCADEIRQRVHSEFYSLGPLDSLMKDESITEILINGPTAIWYEQQGKLKAHDDQFFSNLSYRNIIDRLSHEANIHINSQSPCSDGNLRDFRLSLIGPELTKSYTHLTLRRHPKNPWSFTRLKESNWCSEKELAFFDHLIQKRKNFLVIGSTSSGKTSVLNSFLRLIRDNERAVIIEDTSEISLPNSASIKLLTREDPHGNLPSIDQNQLVKRSLRLRPDRLVMGEIRGSEAKDFLMALSTGHDGSFGTLHAGDPAQALIRLEMLIQMGAPQWSLSAIRKLIMLSLDYIVVVGKNTEGTRQFKGAYRISSLEENGFLIDREEL